MKKIILLGLIFLILGLLFKIYTFPTSALDLIKTDPGSDSRCLQIKVKFTSDTQWKESGSNRYIMVGCDGQGTITNPAKNPPGCTGGLAKLKPGEEVTLGRCSCFFDPDGGCLKVGKELTIEDRKEGSNKRRNVTVVKKLEDTTDIKSGICSYDLIDRDKNRKVNLGSLCGSNKDKFDLRLNITCQGPSPTPTPTITITPSPTPSICPVPSQVTNVKVTCPNCSATPSPTPTPTPTPINSPTRETQTQ